MSNFKKIISLMVVIACFFAFNSILTAKDELDEMNTYNKLFVKFNLEKLGKDVFDKFGFKSNEIFDELGVIEIKVPGNVDKLKYMKQLNENKFVEFVEEDYKVKINFTPNDKEYKKQWGPKAINAEKAWNITKGSKDTKIAVLDTGIQYNHPDLKDNIVSGYNVVMPGLPPEDDNIYYHGTHVSGIIAATIDNHKGIAGIAGNAKIMPVKVIDSEGYGYHSDIMYGIIWATNNGADVINMSFGGNSKSRLFEQIVNYAYNRGVTLIGAAGNENTDEEMYPASYGNVISVAALNEDLSRAYFSNYGKTIDLAAPGVDIYSTVHHPESPYKYYSGTSMAAPFVSGVAALIISKNINLSPYQVKKALVNTAVDLGETGKDSYYGYGLVDAYEALNY